VVLILAGCVGLLSMAHFLSGLSVTFAALSMILCGFSLAHKKVITGALLLGGGWALLSLSAGFLLTAVLGLTALLLPLHPQWRFKRYALTLVGAFAVGLPLMVVYPFLLHRLQPAAFDLWLNTRSLGAFGGLADFQTAFNLPYYLKNLIWFAFPAWPLMAWTYTRIRIGAQRWSVLGTAWIGSAAGLLVVKEIESLGRAVNDPERPYTVVLGGSKVSDKLGVISNLLGKADRLLIGGGMAYTFLAAQGYEVGTSLLEKDQIDTVKGYLETAKANGVELLLPVDTVVAPTFAADAPATVVPADALPADQMGLDIGPKTRELFADAIATSKTVVWNGPMGVFEFPAFAAGKRGAGKEGDVGVVFGLSGIAVEQGAHGLPVAAVNCVKQGFALVGFGVGFGRLPDVFGWNVEAVFAHFLFLFLHGLAGILPQALRGTVV